MNPSITLLISFIIPFSGALTIVTKPLKTPFTISPNPLKTFFQLPVNTPDKKEIIPFRIGFKELSHNSFINPKALLTTDETPENTFVNVGNK